MTIDTIANQLKACRSEQDVSRVRRNVEGWLTPLEIAWLVKRKNQLPEVTQPWLSRLSSVMSSTGKSPQRYRRLSIHPDINLFTDRSRAISKKRLVLAFSGSAGRLLLPTGFVLQVLPSRSVDVALLHDRSRSHYMNGIAGYASDFQALVRRLISDLRSTAYEGVFCFGTSMGGLPALRCGLLIDACRSISVGGRWPWHIRRLAVDDEANLPAFDPLCHCYSARRTNFVCVYSDGNPADRTHADRLATIFDVEKVPVVGATGHNALDFLLTENQLGPFLNDLLGLQSEPRWWSSIGKALPARLKRTVDT